MELKDYPRVLIITVNPLSNTSNNGKTYASFFKNYPKEKLAQLYFHREVPTSSVCDNYYKISDEDMIKNLFRKRPLGSAINSEHGEERLIPLHLNNKLKKSSAIRLMRSIFWLSLNLQKKGVKDWIDNFKPEVIFFCGGDANYLYKKTLKLSKNYKAKLVYYITDDYVLPYFTFNIFKAINRIWTRNCFVKVSMESSLILTIGDKMTNEYKNKYGIESTKIMNLVEIDESENLENTLKDNDLKLVYVGSLHSNRWKILELISKSLERIERQGYRGKLEIYSTQMPESKIMNRINNKKYSKYCGALSTKEVKNTLNNADILLHVESFDKKSKKITKLSVSTKIPEYMASKRCILAIGPKDIASIEYLKETHSGFVITEVDENSLDFELISIFNDVDKRKEYILNADLVVRKNHDANIKRLEFQKSIIGLISKTN